MSSFNKKLFFLLFVYVIVVLFFYCKDWLEIKAQNKIIEQRKPQCFCHTADVVRFRFFYKGIFHIFAIDTNDAIVFQHLKALPNSFAVEYYDLYPQYKTKCPKIKWITKNIANGVVKDRELLDYFKKTTTDLNMVDFN